MGSVTAEKSEREKKEQDRQSERERERKGPAARAAKGTRTDGAKVGTFYEIEVDGVAFNLEARHLRSLGHNWPRFQAPNSTLYRNITREFEKVPQYQASISIFLPLYLIATRGTKGKQAQCCWHSTAQVIKAQDRKRVQVANNGREGLAWLHAWTIGLISGSGGNFDNLIVQLLAALFLPVTCCQEKL